MVKCKYSLLLAGIIATSCILNSCWLYKFRGSTIPVSVRTVSVAYIENKAQLVYPPLSNLITEKLKDKFIKMTRLTLVDEEGDFCFEGEISSYQNSTMGFTADEVGALNRLTITVKINFTSTEKSFEKTFSKFADYPSERSLDTEEARLVDQIVEELIEEIFNSTANDW